MAEVRHALRSLRRNPGFTFTVLITLALAIGANSAVFTLANALIFASLPVPRADRLVQISTADSKGGKSGLSIPAFQALEPEMRQVFLSMLAWNGGGVENLESMVSRLRVRWMTSRAIITRRWAFVRRWAD